MFITVYAKQSSTTDFPMWSADIAIKSEMQLPETKIQEGNLPFNNTTSQVETRSQNESETHINVKSEKTEDCSSNRGETRHWTVCQNGVLNEVKTEPTDGRSDTCETSTCSENSDEQQQQPRNKSIAEVDKQPTSVRLYVCVTYGESIKHQDNLREYERIHTNVKPLSCCTCGESFRHSNNLKHHEMIRTNMKPYTCVTRGIS